MLFDKPKQFLTEEEKAAVTRAIQEAEKMTSGEVRVYIESHCRFVDPIDRAREVFAQLKMHVTEERNGVLLYIAYDDHQLAVLGDEGIYTKVPQPFWEATIGKITAHFKDSHFGEGMVAGLGEIGRALQQYFPFDAAADKNELPDEIVFGK
jgi:uncharacterized membrane protein